MNAVMAPASASAAVAVPKAPSVTISSGRAPAPRNASTISTGKIAAASAIRPNVAKAWA